MSWRFATEPDLSASSAAFGAAIIQPGGHARIQSAAEVGGTPTGCKRSKITILVAKRPERACACWGKSRPHR